MARQYFYALLYTDWGRKLKDILNSLLPGLTTEPQRVRVPVRQPEDRRISGREK